MTVHDCTDVHCTVQLVEIRETPDCVGPGRFGARRLAEDTGPATAVRSYNRHGDQSWANRNGEASGPAPASPARAAAAEDPALGPRKENREVRERDVTV